MMKKSKIVFLVISFLFLLVLAFFIIDFARRTKFPGPKSRKDNAIEVPDTIKK